ncbi:GNAT family N-acetyltransferase [Oceanobacillus kimchii]|uniref:GNAT family N-acetyltransferase n=1 Tax=Oceanobacillus kimchii TaxID=746691 RepID=UPI00232DE14A|nr:GNAT family protein [Oceanobacillus kimchii]
MIKVQLVIPDIRYAATLSKQSSDPRIRDTLGLTKAQSSVQGTIDFIHFVIEAERQGNLCSRIILNEIDEPIGVITLKEIDEKNSTSEIGTWLGVENWGKGYNELAKNEILYHAFENMKLERVFAGAKKTNIRSQKSQEKLPYIKIDEGVNFPEQHAKMESEAREPCILNVIERNCFLDWHKKNIL